MKWKVYIYGLTPAVVTPAVVLTPPGVYRTMRAPL